MLRQTSGTYSVKASYGSVHTRTEASSTIGLCRSVYLDLPSVVTGIENVPG